MAIDASIPLQVNVPQFNPAQTLGQIYQLKNAKQEQAQNALKLQAGQIDLQNMQNQQADDAATRSALSSATSVDPNTGVPTLNRNQALSQLYKSAPKAAMGLQQGWQKSDLEAAKQQLDNQKIDLENKKAHVDLVGQLANGVTDEASYQATRTYALQHNLISPDEMPPQYDPNLVKRAQANALTAKDMLDTQAKKLDQDHASLELARQVAADADQSTYRKGELAQGQQRIRIEQQNANTSSGQLNLATQKQNQDNTASVEAQAQQIASGDVKPLPQGRMNPYNKAVMARAYEINPNLSDQMYKTKQDFLSSTGKANSQVQSLNKLSAHLDELKDASEKAGFSPVGFTSAGKDLRLAEQLFIKEDVKFLSGVGVGTEGELNGLIEKTHSPIQSVRTTAINRLSKFTTDAAQQLGNQYERGTKQKFDPTQHFTPTTVRMMNENGGTVPKSSGSGGGFNWDAHPVVK